LAKEYHDRATLYLIREFSRLLERQTKDKNMPPLEIKGLGNVVADAKKQIATLRAESAGLNQDIRDMVQSVQEVRKQVQNAHDDLKFEAQTLGNAPPPDDDKPAGMDGLQDASPPSQGNSAVPFRNN
jgi:chromosome segregation ATPase